MNSVLGLISTCSILLSRTVCQGWTSHSEQYCGDQSTSSSCTGIGEAENSKGAKNAAYCNPLQSLSQKENKHDYGKNFPIDKLKEQVSGSISVSTQDSTILEKENLMILSASKKKQPLTWATKKSLQHCRSRMRLAMRMRYHLYILDQRSFLSDWKPIVLLSALLYQKFQSRFAVEA